MIEKRTKSALPIYIAAAIFALYALFMPLYKITHFIIAFGITILGYIVSSSVIPDKVTYEEAPPKSTGDAMLDELILEGKNAVSAIKKAANEIENDVVSEKAYRLSELTEKIFAQLDGKPSSYSYVKRFSSYFLPATVKLLTSYRQMELQGTKGENISGTEKKISDVLDTTIAAYEKQLDALFADEALDIETDIEVMKSMIKNQGLSDSDFKIEL